MSSAGELQDLLAALLAEFHGRAAGAWERTAGTLVQVGFVPAADLDPQVARDFADATRSVPLDRRDLGIVRAADSGSVAVSRIETDGAETGSGRWLRAFGATRSVAVPIPDAAGMTRAVWSIALPHDIIPDHLIAARVRDHADQHRRRGSSPDLACP